MAEVLAWHFVATDRKLRDGTTVAAGYTYEVQPPISLCQWGLHASVRPIDALNYALVPVACRVRMRGTIIHGEDKLVATRRDVLSCWDASRELRLSAVWCARDMPLGDGRRMWDLLTDERSRHAVEVAERHAHGEASDDALAAAARAAGAAVGSAAGAVGSAAWAAWAAGSARAAWAAWAAGVAVGSAANEQLEAMLLKHDEGGDR